MGKRSIGRLIPETTVTLMPKMTPEAEAAYALSFGVARSDLPPDAQLAYDRLVEERAAASPPMSPPSGDTGLVNQRPGEMPALPDSMRTAIGLMSGGTALGALFAIVDGAATNDSFDFLLLIVQLSLWLWMLWKVRAGRPWARVLSTVFFGFTCLQFLLVVTAGIGISKFLITVYFVVALSALIMLYRRDSSAFFSAAEFARRSSVLSHALGGYGPPWYGLPAQQYGMPAQQYGLPAQQYGLPAQPYGMPPQQYGQPPQQYGQPPQQYGQPPKENWPPPQ